MLSHYSREERDLMIREADRQIDEGEYIEWSEEEHKRLLDEVREEVSLKGT